MPRFVILQHDHPELHWDFMLEADGVLKTWRLPAPPTHDPRTALAIGDHRLAYLDYEGPVSGGRGRVERWDQGSYLEAENWTLELEGKRWSGQVLLQRAEGDIWTIRFVPRRARSAAE
jgi:hypothetical protein